MEKTSANLRWFQSRERTARVRSICRRCSWRSPYAIPKCLSRWASNQPGSQPGCIPKPPAVDRLCSDLAGLTEEELDSVLDAALAPEPSSASKPTTTHETPKKQGGAASIQPSSTGTQPSDNTP